MYKPKLILFWLVIFSQDIDSGLFMILAMLLLTSLILLPKIQAHIHAKLQITLAPMRFHAH